MDVVDGFGIDERATDGRGQVLAPWPNRLTDGSYRYGGRDCQAPINELGRNTAIHGLVRWLDWSPVAHESTSVTLSCAVRPQPGYEWQLDLEVTYALDDTGLTVTFQAVNADTERAPFGVGFHPYLTLGTTSIDGLQLTVPATSFLDSSRPDGLREMVPVAATPLDFTEPRRIGSIQLDTCFGGLVHGDDRRAVARLADPDDGRSSELWVDDTIPLPDGLHGRRGGPARATPEGDRHRADDLPTGRVPLRYGSDRARTRRVLAWNVGPRGRISVGELITLEGHGDGLGSDRSSHRPSPAGRCAVPDGADPSPARHCGVVLPSSRCWDADRGSRRRRDALSR